MEAIKEMSEIDIYNALHNLGKLNKREALDQLQISVLATAAGMGNKDASRKVSQKVSDMKQEERREQQRETFAKGTPRGLGMPLLSTEDLNKLGEVVKNG